MADYNPHLPSILGQEWAPVAYEPYTMETSVERGTRINLRASATPALGQYFLHAEPTGVIDAQVPFVSIYRAGEEDNTGPVGQVVIPVSGSTAGGASAYTLVGGASSVADAFALSSDGKGISLDANAVTSFLDLAFDAGSVTTLLSGKRITNVSLVYTASGDWTSVNTPDGPGFTTSVRTTADVFYGTGVLSPGGGYNGQFITGIQELSFGEINPFALGLPTASTQRLPWRNTELQQFTTGSGTPMRVRFGWSDATDQRIHYVALRVRYCDETRVLYGGTHIGAQYAPSTQATYSASAVNTVVLRASSGHATGSALPAGQYTVTSCIADIGEMSQPLSRIVMADLTRPVAQALRQAYEIPDLSGVEVVRPSATGLTGRVAVSPVLPRVAFSVTGSTNSQADTHAYGTPYAAPVYQGVSAGQNVGSLATFTQTLYTYVRFYARRYGDSSGPLTVTVPGVSGSPVTAQITAADFDALAEVAGGWREVTLRLSGTVPQTGSVQVVTWSSGSTAGDRWEILAANGVDLGGAANYLTGVYSLQSPAPTPLFTADAAVVLSTESPAPTGVTAVAQTQSLGTVPLLCASPADCIPTGIAYTQLAWGLPPGTGAAYDTFTRSVGNGWGFATTGQAWTSGGGSASDYSVDGTTGRILMSSVNVSRRMTLPTTAGDATIVTLSTVSAAASGAGIDTSLMGRYQDSNNYYHFLVQYGTDGIILARIRRNVAGSFTDLTVNRNIPNAAAGAGSAVWIKAEMEGPNLRMKVWPQGQAEPGLWTATATDTTYTSGTVGVRANLASGNLNSPPPTVTYDSFSVTPVASTHGYTEVQRLDYVDLEWETIARITSPGVSSMRDYEARIGTLNIYRVRRVNTLGFEGAWSSSAGVLVAQPGVTGAGDAAGTLLFTSNADQAGAMVYAYTETGDQAPSWEASFAEAGQVTYTALADRDYVTAAHPVERGSVSFTANLMTNRGAPSLAALERGWRGLRDLAWATLPYVCVRTDGGDRWYAGVTVPSGSMRRRPADSIGIAQVGIMQISGEPAAVDIPWGP